MAREAPQIERGMTRQKADEHADWLCKLLSLENESGMVGMETVRWLLTECLLHGAKHEREG